MGTRRFFVSFFLDGKYIGAHYSENLDELITIKVVYQGCKIDILDMDKMERLSAEEVRLRVKESAERWKKDLERKREVKETTRAAVKPKVRKVNVKTWERPVVCVETGQRFKSIRECSDILCIPYKTIHNCIIRGNATRGVHFVAE